MVGRSRFLLIAALAAVASQPDFSVDIPVAPSAKKAARRRYEVLKPRYTELPMPDLNRAKRHPPAQSYRHAAQIAFGLGFRADDHPR